MPVTGKIAAAVIIPGLALGAMLGAAANPVMKRPTEQWWQGGDRNYATQSFADTGQPDSWAGNGAMPDSYRPNLDYSATITSYWEPPADWNWYGEDEPESVAPDEDSTTDAVPQPAEKAADDAVEVADAALAAESAAPPAPAEPSPLGNDGLY